MNALIEGIRNFGAMLSRFVRDRQEFTVGGLVQHSKDQRVLPLLDEKGGVHQSSRLGMSQRLDDWMYRSKLERVMPC
jgi:hypothetical protein